MSILFFFTLYAGLRSLLVRALSFPTLRFSVLLQADDLAGAVEEAVGRVVGLHADVQLAALLDVVDSVSRRAARQRRRGQHGDARRQRQGDRKSTRLNSSH